MNEFDQRRRERLELYNITDDTFHNAELFWPIVSMQFGDMIHRFYEHVLSNPATRQYFQGDGLVERARSRQSRHWYLLFNDRIGLEYMQSAMMTAERHLQMQVCPHHYMSAYDFFLNELTSLAFQHYRGDPAGQEAAIKTVNKLVLIDIDITLSVYTRHLFQRHSIPGAVASAG